MMNFIRWFKGSLEDQQGIASFRRIYNYVIIDLVTFVVIWASVKEAWSMFYIYTLIILLVAGFLNTSVITADNILRFFNRDRNQPDQPPQQPLTQQQHIEGDLNITPKTTST